MITDKQSKNKKIILIITGVLILSVIISGCFYYLNLRGSGPAINKAPIDITTIVPSIPSASTTNAITDEKIASSTEVVSSTQIVSYLISPDDTTKYCNGVDMDSSGYRKTITVEKSTNTPEINPTIEQKIKIIIDAATTGMCRNVLNQLNITENNGIVSIPPIEGWAGISITMCSCKPQVEVNLLRIPGVTKVIWSTIIVDSALNNN